MISFGFTGFLGGSTVSFSEVVKDAPAFIQAATPSKDAKQV